MPPPAAMASPLMATLTAEAHLPERQGALPRTEAVRNRF
jgi:hypothetical protein